MRLNLGFIWLGAALAILPQLADAGTGENVVFRSAPVQPSPFQVKRAKAKGITLEPKPGIELSAQLFRPEARGRQAAVIVLVSGDGLQNSHLAWGQALADWGYVGLVVDSFGSRGGTNYRDTPGVDVPADADAALSYLGSLDFVDKRNVGVIGFSLGGSRLFSILDKAKSPLRKTGSFRAAIALYPNCAVGRQLTAPLLIMAGDADPMMTLGECTKVHADAAGQGNPVVMHVFSGATHFFDNPAYRKDVASRTEDRRKPLWYETNHYDEGAHKDALRRARTFLQRYLR